MTIKSQPGLQHRLRNKTELADVLREQSLINGNVNAAQALAKCVQLCRLEDNYEFMTQGAEDNDIYFILKGSVGIEVNQRRVAVRNAGEHVGEMALMDKTASRSATGITIGQTILAKVNEPDFSKVADKYPVLWRRCATILGKRLRERTKYHKAPRSKPVIFIGSSKEGEVIGKTIYGYLKKKDNFVPKLWSEDIFRCSRTTIEELVQIANEVDIAILVCTPDDFIKSRGQAKRAPRDNIIFETGLFMGAISRERTVVVAPVKQEIKLPTDLLGITMLPYHIKRGQSLAKSLLSLNKKINVIVGDLGPI